VVSKDGGDDGLRDTLDRASVPVPARRAARERLLAAIRTYGADAAFVVVLVGLALFVRWIRLEPIENGGDPLDNWYFVRQWHHENLAYGRIDHHASRFGIHWITYVAQLALGTHPRVYYAPPLFASVVCTALTYVVGRQVSGKLVGFVAALLVLECEPFVSASSQLRPAIFETMYALAAVACLVQSIGAPRARPWLVGSAILVFLAYLSHEPDAFLVPGMLLVVWASRRNVRDVLVFGGTLAVLLLAETAAYSLFTQYWGRIDVLSGSHLQRPGPPRTFGYLLERFTKADDAVKFAFYPFFLTGPLLLIFARNIKERSVALVCAGFLLLATFFVRSVDPLIVFMQHRDRYILVVVPLAYITTLHCIVGAGTAILERFGRHAKAIPHAVPPLLARGIVCVGVAALVVVVGWRATNAVRRPHPFRSIDAIYETLNDTYQRNLPIIGKVSRRMEKITQVRTLHWAHKGFLKDEFFLSDGSLRDFSYGDDLAELNKNERYFPDVPVLDAARVRALEKRGCALRLTSRGTSVELSRKKRLPQRCDP
jgi:hypothetical protein